MKLISIVGARPQFVKLAPLCQLLDQEFDHLIIHTGQHFDDNMSTVFFEEMGIPKPVYNLGVSSGFHGKQTAKILSDIEPILIQEKPDYVLVFGDTNTTLAAALAASKLCIPIVHVEAGLRSFDKQMPEEQNRIVTDHLASILACPTQTAIENLTQEGITDGVFFTGDLMFDVIKLYENKYKNRKISSRYSNYSVLTLHRPSNVDSQNQLKKILNILNNLDIKFIFPVHPRTRNNLKEFQIEIPKNIECIDPQSYLDMMSIICHSNNVFTDSGGMQKEAFFLNKKCITLRNTTEWTETIEANANMLAIDHAGAINGQGIVEFLGQSLKIDNDSFPYGNGNAAQEILNCLK